MSTSLVVFFLSIQSSYSRDNEAPATEESFDTVQYYSAGGTSWRIRTYAQDHDVHVWNIGIVDDLVALARENTMKHYGDVVTEGYIMRADSLEGVRGQLLDKGLPAGLEISGDGFAFWAPEGSAYRTRTEPSQT